MSVSKIQTAMLWLKKERPLPFGKLVKTLVQKRGTLAEAPPKVQREKENVPADKLPASSIQISPELMNLKEGAKPKPEPEVAPPPPPPPKAEEPPVKAKPSASDPPPVIAPMGPVAVLALDEHGTILSAAQACEEILGCGPPALVGQSVSTLLKGGLDNEVGQFMERHRAGKTAAGTTTLRVTGLRKNGTEFPATVTAVNWGWDTTIIVKGSPARLTWTAAFRDLSGKAQAKATPIARPNTPDAKLLTERVTTPAAPASPEPKLPDRNQKLEEELAAVKKQRDQLNARAKAEEAAATDVKKQLEEFEKQRVHAIEELKNVKAELAKREGAPPPAAQPPAPPEAAKRFEEQLAVLRWERDELNAKAKAEEAAAADLKKRLAEFERQRAQAADELQKVKAELARRESAVAAERHSQDADAAKRFEEQLAILRRERDELSAKAKAEEAGAAELKKRLEELERQRAQAAEELQKVKAEVAKHESATPPKHGSQDAEAAKRLEEQLAILRRERDELNAKAKAEEVAATDLKKRLEEFEKQRAQAAEELQKIKADLATKAGLETGGTPEAAKRFEEQLAVLRQERDELTAKLTAEKTAAAEMKYRLEEIEKHLTEAANAKARLEEEMAGLRQERDELHGKVTAEQLVSGELNYRIQELEGRWALVAGDLENAKAYAANQELSEADLRNELETAKQAVFYMEAALKEEVARREKLSERLQNLSHSLKQEQADRSKRFEQDMITLRQERDELDAKLAAEQKEAAEAARRAQELEMRLKSNAEGFDRAKTELEELQAKIEAERKAAEESNERAKAVESRLGKNAAEFDRAKAELEKQEAEREKLEAEWREQLDAAHALKARLESSLAEARERNKRLEGELLGLRGERNELKAKVTVGEEAAAEAKREADELRSKLDANATQLEQLKAALEKQTAEEERTEAEWRKQLEGAQALTSKLEISLAEAKERAKETEQELTQLRQERNDLKAKLGVEEESAAESGRKAKELQARLDEKETAFKELKAALAKNTAEHQRAEARWHEQQASATALKKQLEADCAEATERDARIRQELSSVRQDRDELKSRLKTERLNGEEATRRAEDLERRLDRASADLDRAKADLAKREAELERSERKWREQLDEATAKTREFEAAWSDATDERKRFAEELAALEQERDDLRARLTAAASKRTPVPTARISARTKKLAKGKSLKSVPSKPSHQFHVNTPADDQGTLETVPVVDPASNGNPAHIQQYDFSLTPSNGHAPAPVASAKGKKPRIRYGNRRLLVRN